MGFLAVILIQVMELNKFVTAINCIDGRAQDPAEHWLQNHFKADFVDMITQPGPEKALVLGTDLIRNELKEKVSISVNAHGSHTIAIFGHFDCAGNVVSKTERINEIKKAVEIIQSWKLAPKVVGLYINEDWQPEEVVV